jgi:dTDP-4-dehydrorhamnose 3,5-epimerase
LATRIRGVKVKKLKIFGDERGFFSEIFRCSEDIFQEKLGQLSFSTVFVGVAKAWHLHKVQTDWMCVLSGDMKLVLYDTRKGSKTYGRREEILMGETFGIKVVRIPPGIAHGYKVVNGPMKILYVADREYDPKDDLRIPHDDPQIGYDWTADPKIK